VIVSASYRTDIPAFYGRWFVNRLAAGGCRVVNPWGGQIYEVPLDGDSVDGFVFWTRNAAPFGEGFAAVRRMARPFIVQFTVTGYPRALEPSVPDGDAAIAQIRDLARCYGLRATVWRYDPVVISSLTPPAFHRRNFAALCAALRGAVDEVVVSFAHIYRKTRRNMDRAAREHGFTWRDPEAGEKAALCGELAAIAAEAGMALRVCAQPEFLGPGAAPARCIDADRLSDVAGYAIKAPRQGNRPGCLCHRSRDIGAYDTCPQGCVYCYAVSDQKLAVTNRRRHDPGGELLLPSA
jgi:hypothetical protein